MGLLIPILLVTSACVIRTRPLHHTVRPAVQVHATPPSGQIQVQVVEPQVGAGVVIVESNCQPGAQEVCNGMDDNCDGQIDEGCGYPSGAIQITAHWNTGADIDLYVYDPSGERIYYGDRRSRSGGQLDHDARGACNRNQANNRIENIFWNTPNPPSGNYRVELHYWSGSPCSSQQGPTTATVAISVGGQVLGNYRHTLQANQRTSVATFRIP